LAGSSFEGEAEGSGNNEHKPLFSRVLQCFVDGYNPSESFTRHGLSALLDGTLLVDVHMENALAGILDSMYPLVAPRELSVVTSEYVESAVFYTDGSLIEGSAGFAVHQTGVGGFGFRMSSSAGVFSAELSALFMALRHIGEVIYNPQKNA
jgi:hypothetical protein